LLSINQVLSILICFILIGCGFQPLYKPIATSDSYHLEAIKISRIKDRPGQILRNYLLDIFNPSGEPDQPLYRLDVSTDVKEDAFSFRKDATPSRALIKAKAEFRLVEIPSKKVIYKDNAEATTSYGIGPSADFAVVPAITSKATETDRAMNLLAQEIKLQISSFLATYHNKGSG
jgi:hypothetical protein